MKKEELDFKQFSQSKIKMTEEEYEELFGGATYCNGNSVYCYTDGLAIQILPDGKYSLVLGNAEYASKNNIELELMLYVWSCEEFNTNPEGVVWANNLLVKNFNHKIIE